MVGFTLDNIAREITIGHRAWSTLMILSKNSPTNMEVQAEYESYVQLSKFRRQYAQTHSTWYSFFE